MNKENNFLSTISAFEMGELQWEKHKDLFDEKPPTVEQFLNDPYYLGCDEIGIKDSIYPIWVKNLKKLHPHPFLKKYNECITSGAIGIGKTFGLATLSGLLELCFHLCMKIPASYYIGLVPTTTLAMKVFSSNLEKAKDVNWEDIEKIIKHSPFFRKYVLDDNSKSSNDTKLKGKRFNFQKNIKIEIASTIEHAQGEAIIVLIYDEAGGKRSKDKDPNKAYLDLVVRRKSRLLMAGGRVGGMLHLLGEAEGEDSFLEIRKESIRNTQAKDCLIIENVSQWEAKKHLGIYNKKEIPNVIDESFKVFLGNKTQDPFLVENDSEISNIDGEVIEVPVAYKTDFLGNLIHCIKKFAGRANSRSAKLFKNKSVVINTFKLPNWFNVEEIVLTQKNPDGTINTVENIIDFVKDIEKFKNQIDPFLYRFVHIDVGRTKDRLSASSCYSQFRNYEYYRNSDGINSMTDKIYFVEWTLTLKAKQGQEIPLNKVVEFFVYITQIGYNIHQISTDQKEGSGAYMRQELNRHGLNCIYLSVDTSNIPYEILRDIMLYGSIVGVKTELTIFELIHLNHFGDRIDHDSDKSKDVADGIAGAVYACATSELTYNPALLVDSYEEQEKDDLMDLASNNMLDNFLNNFM